MPMPVPVCRLSQSILLLPKAMAEGTLQDANPYPVVGREVWEGGRNEESQVNHI